MLSAHINAVRLGAEAAPSARSIALFSFLNPYVLLQYPVNFSSQDGILFTRITMQ